MPEDRPPYRLPETVRPLRYAIHTEPDLNDLTFTGVATIAVAVTETTDSFLLNAADLTFGDVTLTDASGGTVGATTTFIEAEEQASLAFANPVTPGEYTLRITYEGTLNDQLRGFYRSTWKDASGVEHTIATTQMEATDARRAFPCWDEPAFKATFQIDMVVPADVVGIAGGETISTTPQPDGRVLVHTRETEVISTYLVAMSVGPFAFTDPQTVAGTQLSIGAVRDEMHMTGFAEESAAHSLQYFTDYFGIPYPEPKLVHLAIPDFSAGAMENWGLITYRSTALLADPATASRPELERIAEVIAHETAHLWFGDMVTMKWWNGLWLKEAFATFMAAKENDDFKPEWKIWESFTLSRSAAMGVDGLLSTRPIEYTVKRPNEIEAMYDLITYEKGASVMRMLEMYLGEGDFQRGMQLYMQRHRYSNTETTDLWSALQDATGKPVNAVMDTWIFQPGYPLVTVSRNDDGDVVLGQHVFKYLANEVDGATSHLLWKIPVKVRASVGGSVVEKMVLLEDASDVIDFGGPVDWAVVNADGWGVFRTAYQGDMLGAVLGRYDTLSVSERFNLVNDTWAAVRSGSSSLADFMQLGERLAETERDPNVWAALVGNAGSLRRASSDAALPGLRAWFRDLTAPVLAEVGYDPIAGEDPQRSDLRTRVLGLAGGIGADPAVRAWANDVRDRYLANPKSVPPESAAIARSLVAATAHETDADNGLARWEQTRRALDTATSPQAKVKELVALCSFEAPELFDRTLALIENPSVVRTQDMPFAVNTLMSQRVNGPKAWAYVTEHVEELRAKVPPKALARLFSATSSLTTPELVSEVRAFLEGDQDLWANPQIRQYAEEQRINVRTIAQSTAVVTARFGTSAPLDRSDDSEGPGLGD